MNNKKYFIFLIFILILSSVYYQKPIIVNAQTFVSNSFKIDFGNFNMTSGKKSSTTYKLTDTVGQNAPGQFNNSGYIVKSGFQYINEQIIPLSFIIDNLDLNFNNLTPNIGSTITNTLTISTPTVNGYEILVIANHPLTTIGTNNTIPDTKCDTYVCSESVSGSWNSNSTYGFGFNANGSGTSDYFTNSTYFRQFADNSLNEGSAVIASENTPVQSHSTLITYKVNISPIQPAGIYQNSINFIAIPKY